MTVGNPAHAGAVVNSEAEAWAWLERKARELYPKSDFAIARQTGVRTPEELIAGAQAVLGRHLEPGGETDPSKAIDQLLEILDGRDDVAIARSQERVRESAPVGTLNPRPRTARLNGGRRGAPASGAGAP